MSAFNIPRPLIHLVVAILSTVALNLLLTSAYAYAAPSAATFNVNSTLDAVDANPGDGVCATSGNLCTLRAAIMEANHTPGGGATINVPAIQTASYEVAIPPSGSDDETTGDLNITARMSIVGKPTPFFKNVTIDAGLAHDRVFTISGLGVTISNITNITNGQALIGGGIFNQGVLTLNNSTVSVNTTTKGGGGIYSNPGAILTLNNSTISGNTTSTQGGGIYNGYQTNSTLNNSTISGNTAVDGGGISNNGSLTLNDSTVSRNTASDIGGGLENGGELTVTNSTFSGNSSATGSGIYEYSSDASAVVTFEDSILNGGSSGTNCHVQSGSLTTIASGGYNISSDTSCASYFTATGDLNNTNPQLGPLANNGGPTQTHALLSGSPAIDQIPSGTNGCGTTITIDQRGDPRPVNGKCDMGAYEATSGGTICANKPPAPSLLKPINNKQVTKTQVMLQWSTVPCAAQYKVVVKVGSTTGTKVDGKTLTATEYKTIALPAKKKYYWRVGACDASGCTNSGWFEFTRE